MMSGASISLSEYHELKAKAMTEAQLQLLIVKAAQATGWLVYHTYDSRRSEPGYPDLHLVHPTRGVSLMRELKKQNGVVSKPQKAWIEGLTAAGIDIAIWRPIDWFDGTITRALTGALS
jgi:hypothetical protein